MPNKYYNEGWCWTFLRKYAAILPLWSAFGNPLRKRFSNAVAENNFRHNKHDILGGATNLKATFFIDKIEPRHSALKMIALSLEPFYAKKVKPKAKEVRAFWLKRDKKKSTYFTNLRNKQLLENVGHELPRVIMKSVEIWPNSLPKDPKYFDISGRDNVVVAKVGSAELHLEDFSSELIDFLVNYLKPLRLSTYVSCALSTLTLDGNVVEAEV